MQPSAANWLANLHGRSWLPEFQRQVNEGEIEPPGPDEMGSFADQMIEQRTANFSEAYHDQTVKVLKPLLIQTLTDKNAANRKIAINEGMILLGESSKTAQSPEEITATVNKAMQDYGQTKHRR